MKEIFMVPPVVAMANADAAAIEQLLVHERLMRSEADHRMANFLQIVSFNLERAARHEAGSTARLQLEQAVSQLMSINSVHRALDLRSHDGLEDAAEKIRELCMALESLLLQPVGHTLGLTISVVAGDLMVRADLARCLAAVMTELVINATKHAFAKDRRGHVVVTLSRTQDHIVCTVRDDGTGSLQGTIYSTSQGMVLAQTLAARFGGGCKWVFGCLGTEATVTLPLKSPSSDFVAPHHQPAQPIGLWNRILGREA